MRTIWIVENCDADKVKGVSYFASLRDAWEYITHNGYHKTCRATYLNNRLETYKDYESYEDFETERKQMGHNYIQFVKRHHIEDISDIIGGAWESKEYYAVRPATLHGNF